MSTLDDPPARVRQEQPGDQEDERAGEVAGGEPLGQDRPAEDHDRQCDQRGFVHGPRSTMRLRRFAVFSPSLVGGRWSAGTSRAGTIEA